ncbi:MAG: DNA-directed RNA polymerase subunit P [Thermoprotei archaeon]
MVVKYKCGRCGAVFDEEKMKRTYGRFIRCPECGYNIIYKIARSYRIVKAI